MPNSLSYTKYFVSYTKYLVTIINETKISTWKDLGKTWHSMDFNPSNKIMTMFLV